MQFANAIDIYKNARYTAFKWINELSIPNKLILTLVFSCLTGLSAQMRVPLPFTPVPVTGQVFAVLLSATILGGYYGSISQIFYIILGIIGIPWFTNAGSGMMVITGVTGGYLIGYIPSAFIVGLLTSKYKLIRRFHFQLLLMITGIAIIYTFGAIQFAFVLHKGFTETLKLAVLPFILVDIIKASIVTCISNAILPKK